MWKIILTELKVKIQLCLRIGTQYDHSIYPYN